MNDRKTERDYNAGYRKNEVKNMRYRMKSRIISLILLAAVLVSCTQTTEIAITPTSQLPTNTLPQPEIKTTPAPDVDAAAAAFLEAWKAENYDAMYDAVTRIGQEGITREDFTQIYRDVAVTMTMQTLDYRLLSTLTNSTSAQATYEVIFHTALFTDITVNNITMNLALEDGAWKVQWDEGLIMPDLKGGNRLSLDLTIPARGTIFDRNQTTMVTQSDVVALGIWPGKIPEGKAGTLDRELSRLTGKTPESIRALYENAGPDWYIPVGEAPAAAVDARANALAALGDAVVQNRYSSRYYFDGGVAPHVTGYVQPIPVEQLEYYKRLGYRQDQKVGMTGLEWWGEEYLAGTRGATLYVTGPDGVIITRLAQVDSRPAQDISTTLDYDLQLNAQQALTGFRGAIVVLERDTGRILAMVSTPGYDPNVFEPANYNSSWLLGEMFASDEQPLLNRATLGVYPLGSIFKIITMSAALESGLYTKDTKYECGYFFTELEGQEPLEDWTYAKGVPPSGTLTLVEGLMRSCNTYFYHIGLDLYRQKGGAFLSNMAIGFGLGSPTGIIQLDEESGNVSLAQSEGDGVQMAIGQGTLLVTPLQVAQFVAAVGNGGTIYQPQLIEKITSLDGTETNVFQPIEKSKLPVSEENLKIVQDGMRRVVANQRGTAYRFFSGFPITVYGKTGTATNPGGESHAWFAGYTDVQIEGKPNIAIVVLAENAGEGSRIAAPIFRRVAEYYFYNRPGPLYPWESTYFVTQTPTDLYTKTPTEVPPATETPPVPTPTTAP
jgi:penicillin-binding protein 2